MTFSITSPTSLRSEEEIISTWKGDIHKPLVSIRCITFNHAAYIEDAIKGFLIQETNFPIEVWIHDDASTDGTQEIVQDYQKRYPRIIKTILQEENQYSKGMMPSSFVDPHCLGEFYADCEGDDWWISPIKLQRQVDVLLRNSNVDIIFSNAYKVCDLTHDRVGGLGFKSKNAIELYNLNALLKAGLASIPTASVVVRSKVLKATEYQDFLEKYRSSFVVKFLASIRGGALFVNEYLCCYRVNVKGSHSERVKNDANLNLKFFYRVNEALAILNDYSNYKFDHEVSQFQRRRLLKVLNYRDLSLNQIRSIVRNTDSLLKSWEEIFFLSKIASVYLVRKLALRVIHWIDSKKGARNY